MSELREAFQRQAPPAPPTHGWADRARAKQRRRRAAGGAVALGAVTLLAVPLGIALLGNTGEPVVPAEPAPTFPTITAAELCDPFVPPSETADENIVAIDELPDAPARVWLCPDAPDVSNVVFPDEPLTDPDAVSEAIATFNSYPDIDLAAIMCTEEYRMTYTAVFEYLDGQRLPVRGELHGCRLLYTGPADEVHAREGGEEFLNTLTGLWATQRAESDVSARLGPEACTGPTLVPAEPAAVVGGFVCAVGPSGAAPEEVLEIPPEVATAVASLEFGPSDAMMGERLTRVALVDEAGGNLSYLYDGERLVDERDWLLAAVPEADLKSQLDDLRQQLGG
ncbi:hypothetical protein [Tessaracoccus oleiagri]|uniref:Uncharacterized protein n=1 Tax=Tessaracoccus oleiagri TaxID=686624 RepID=A0A1G9IHP3_9ACTN|nr:hypothetical protein [Tessaracoccus oleiagri]SDL24433.1 hypothetical protein SAMN04488242_0934 [Tessaracoccus oleiagri]